MSERATSTAGLSIFVLNTSKSCQPSLLFSTHHHHSSQDEAAASLKLEQEQKAEAEALRTKQIADRQKAALQSQIFVVTATYRRTQSELNALIVEVRVAFCCAAWCAVPAPWSSQIAGTPSSCPFIVLGGHLIFLIFFSRLPPPQNRQAALQDMVLQYVHDTTTHSPPSPFFTVTYPLKAILAQLKHAPVIVKTPKKERSRGGSGVVTVPAVVETGE